MALDAEAETLLGDGDYVKEPIQLAIAAPIHTDGDVAAARTRHGCGSALGGERTRVAVIAEIACVTDQPRGDHVRHTMHRCELSADLRGENLHGRLTSQHAADVSTSGEAAVFPVSAAARSVDPRRRALR